MKPAQNFAPELLLKAQGSGLGMKAAIFDVDGVLTDGRLFIGEQGDKELLHHVLLAHYAFFHLPFDQVHERTGLLDAVIERTDALGSDTGGSGRDRGRFHGVRFSGRAREFGTQM